MVSDRNRKIQDRAYEIWVEGGRQDGTSDHNWAQAEREIGPHDHPASHPAEAGEPIPASAGKAKTTKSKPPKEKPSKDKASKDKPPKAKAAAAAPAKGKKAAKSKSGDPKARSET